MKIRDATVEDLPRLAELYIQGLSGSFFAKIGSGFVTELLRALLKGNMSTTRVLDMNGSVQGFITFSAKSKQIFKDALRNNFFKLTINVLVGTLKKPDLISEIIETFRYARISGRDDIDAEFIYISIDPKFRNNRFSNALVGDALSNLSSKGVKAVKVSTEIDNIPPQRLLKSFGFKVDRQFIFHKKPMLLYVLDPIPSEIPYVNLNEFGGFGK